MLIYNLYLSELKLFFSLSSCICVCAIFVVNFDLKLIVYVLLKFRRFLIPTLLFFFVFIFVFKNCWNFYTLVMIISRVSSANRLKTGPLLPRILYLFLGLLVLSDSVTFFPAVDLSDFRLIITEFHSEVMMRFCIEFDI